jgi:hypothetical protein
MRGLGPALPGATSYQASGISSKRHSLKTIVQLNHYNVLTRPCLYLMADSLQPSTSTGHRFRFVTKLCRRSQVRN